MNRSAFAVPPECAVECAGNLHAPWIMWMALPHQSGRRQGVRSASCNLLAIEDLGIGSGWQQSKQHWALPAVIRHSVRMGHGRLYSVKVCNSKHILKSLDAAFVVGGGKWVQRVYHRSRLVASRVDVAHKLTWLGVIILG